MNYEDIKQIIESNIKDNDKGEITAEVLRDVLMELVGVLSDGYIFGGVVTPADSPRYADAKMFFIAREPGLYENFGALDVSSLGVIMLDEDWSWSWVSLFPKYANELGDSENIGISQKGFTQHLGQAVIDVIETSYRDFLHLARTSELVPGKSYRIIDYFGPQPIEYEYDNVGDSRYHEYSIEINHHRFDIVVKAISVNEISNEACAMRNIDDDGYFANTDFSKWRLKVSIDNPTIKFAQGLVVYHMRDEFGNEAPYDFKNLLFRIKATKNVYYTFTRLNDNGTFTDASLGVVENGMVIGKCCNNIISPQIIDGYYYTNANIFITDNLLTSCIDNKIGSGYMNIIYGASSRNTIEDGCEKNILRGSNADNIIGSKSRNNTIGQGCERNTMGQGCESNILGVNCIGNVFGNSCRDNELGNGSSYNSFGNYCYKISIKNNIKYCEFLSHCMNINIATKCEYVTFGLNCLNIEINGNYGVYYTNFGNGCHAMEVDLPLLEMRYFDISPGTSGKLSGTQTNYDRGYSLIAGKRNDGNVVFFNPLEKGITLSIDDEKLYVNKRGMTWKEVAADIDDIEESTTYQDEKTVMTYQGRLLLLDGEYVYANDVAKPAIYKTKEYPLGTWIEATDGSLISSENWNTEGAGKTAQSVVLITADHQFRIGLQNAYSSACAWGGYGTDVTGITNKTAWTSAVKDFNAKENTDAIIAALNPNWTGEALDDGQTSGHIDSSTVVFTGSTATTKGAPAAEACRLYASGNIAAGKWDLPAFGHLYLMYLNKAAINACLTACGGVALTNDYNWSSTEYYSSPAWFLSFASGNQLFNAKYSSFYVRAVSAF